MTALRISGRWLALSLVLTRPSLAAAQALYAGAGLGRTVVLAQPADVKTTYSGTYGVLGLQSSKALGIRLEGTETWGFLWLSADLTYRLGAPSWVLRPYVLAGGGLRADISNADPIGTGGFGVRIPLARLVALFGESRFHYVLTGQGTRSFLLFTVGVVVGR